MRTAFPMVVLMLSLAATACRADVQRLSEEELLVAEARRVIGIQLGLLQEKNVEELKKHFTERQRKKIDAKMVERAASELGKPTIDELVTDAQPGQFDGKKTLKLKMKNGRTLTTLVQEGDQWLSDTLWFK